MTDKSTVKAGYRDILELIDKKPTWYTREGVPRYCDPDPDRCSNVYADKVCFYVVGCQSCGEEFIVEAYTTRREEQLRAGQGWPAFEPQNLHYGDPPHHDREDCGAGTVMNSIPRRVHSFWERPSSKWQKVEGFEELDLTPDWAANDEF